MAVSGLRKREAEEHEFVFNPVATTRLEPGDEMIILGGKEQIASFKAYANAS